jgi:type IV fimbrial biogenesis protein FimT
MPLISIKSAQLAGLTLIEMMITLSIAAIILAIAAPAFNGWVSNMAVRSTAQSLQAAFQQTRSEAVLRNAVVRLVLGNSNGLPNWSIGCVRVSANCPAVIRQFNADSTDMARIGVSTTSASLNNALVAGAGLPAEVSFNAMGAVARASVDTDIQRVDITHLTRGDTRRQVILIENAGLIRLCDPAVASGGAGGCN